jgi:hypothetical protein
MEVLVGILKYIFVVGAAVEGLLVVRSLVQLARDKARAAELPTMPSEE